MEDYETLKKSRDLLHCILKELSSIEGIPKGNKDQLEWWAYETEQIAPEIISTMWNDVGLKVHKMFYGTVQKDEAMGIWFGKVDKYYQALDKYYQALDKHIKS